MEPTSKPTNLMNRKFGCLPILFSLILLWYGIDNIHFAAADTAVAARYPSPVTLTYEEFVRRRPSQGWFRITGGVVDIASARASRVGVGSNVKETGAIISVEAPLRSAKGSSTKPPYVSVFSMDHKLIDAWKHVDDVAKGVASDGPKDNGVVPQSAAEKEVLEASRVSKYIAAHPDKVFFPRDVEGIIRPGDSSEFREEFASSGTAFAPEEMDANYVRLEEGTTGADYKTHTATNGVLSILAVVLYWGWRIWRGVLTRRRAKDHVAV